MCTVQKQQDTACIQKVGSPYGKSTMQAIPFLKVGWLKPPPAPLEICSDAMV